MQKLSEVYRTINYVSNSKQKAMSSADSTNFNILEKYETFFFWTFRLLEFRKRISWHEFVAAMHN